MAIVETVSLTNKKLTRAGEAGHNSYIVFNTSKAPIHVRASRFGEPAASHLLGVGCVLTFSSRPTLKATNPTQDIKVTSL